MRKRSIIKKVLLLAFTAVFVFQSKNAIKKFINPPIVDSSEVMEITGKKLL